MSKKKQKESVHHLGQTISGVKKYPHDDSALDYGIAYRALPGPSAMKDPSAAKLTFPQRLAKVIIFFPSMYV